MSKAKRIAAICMASALSATAIASVTACSSTEDLVKDGKTVNVKLTSAGYGTSYVYEMQKKFEAAFAEEGYKLNIFTPQAGLTGEKVVQDIATGTGADLYISGTVTESLLSTYAGTVADITELVANKKPIGFNGQEVGTKTIAQILDENTYGYIGLQKADGSYYAVPWTSGVRGLLVNTAVLEDYSLEIPKTTKEFFNCYDVIMAQAAETGIFPITHIAETNNYPVSFTTSWLAQYEGFDWYQQFLTFENNGSNLTKAEAVEMFNAEGVSVMLENMFRALDPNCGTYGSKTQNVEKAQAKLMNGSCAFMMNGDWFISETYANYSDAQRANITFVSVPVLSELGVKIFGAGTAYNKSEADCEAILRAIVDEVDLNKSVEEIKAVVDSEFSMNVSANDVQLIAEARGYTYTESNETGMYINAKSEVKEIAALFARMCCSEEGGRLIAENTYSSNPFATSYEASRFEFVNQTRALQTNRYFKGIRPIVKGYRATIAAEFTDLFPFTGTYLNLKIIEKNISIYNEETLAVVGTTAAYKSAAQTMQTSIYNDANTNYNDKW